MPSLELLNRDSMPSILFQAFEPQRRHQHSDQDRQGEPRGLQDNRQPEQQQQQQQRGPPAAGGSPSADWQRGDHGPPEEAHAVLPGDGALGRQTPLPEPEAVLPAHDGAEAGDGEGGDCGRARELLKKKQNLCFW